MQKLTISVLLALNAFVLFSSADADVDMINVVNLLSNFVKVENKTIDTILDNNKLSQANRKDPKMADLVKLLEKISKIDWKAVEKYIIKNKFTQDRTLSVDGKKIPIQTMFQLLERVGKINWVTFSALFSSVSSAPRLTSSAPASSRVEDTDVKIINERLNRIKSVDWSKK